MRITNAPLFNANPLAPYSNPELLVGYTGGPYGRPDTGSFFTGKPVGSQYIYVASIAADSASAGPYAIVETWQKTGNSGLLASDWRCVSGVLTYRLDVNDMTDGGSTAGTLDLTPQLPAGSFVLGSTVNDVVGFAGDTTAVLIIGTSGTTNQFCTSTFNVFATAAIPAAVTTQNTPSGARGATAAVTVRVTVTTGSDFTLCKTNAAGRATVSIWYLA